MKLAKDVIILGIQQYRIPSLVSSGFFTSLCHNSQKAEKCDASVRKLDFLRSGRSGMAFASHGISAGKLLCGSACCEAKCYGEEQKMEDQETGK